MQLSRLSLAPLALAALVALPSSVLAAGSSSDDDIKKPKPTETVTQCEDGYVWDKEQKLCVAATEGAFLDKDLLNEAHSLATYGRAASAEKVLEAVENPNTTKAQTIMAFSARKAGDMTRAMDHYNTALSLDPENILALSYMGQGMLKSGDEVGAYEQLKKIASVQGKDNWPYRALEKAISGLDTDY